MEKEFDLIAKNNREVLENLKRFNTTFGYLNLSAHFLVGTELIEVIYDADKAAYEGRAVASPGSKITFTTTGILDAYEFISWRYKVFYSLTEAMSFDGFDYEEMQENFSEYCESVKESFDQLKNAWSCIMGDKDE